MDEDEVLVNDYVENMLVQHGAEIRPTQQKRVTAKKCCNPFKLWCRDQDLNQGHTDFQSVALPTELSRQLDCKEKTN